MNKAQQTIAMYVVIGIIVLVFAYQVSGAFADGIRGVFGIEPDGTQPDYNPAPLPDLETTGVDLTEQEALEVRQLAMRLHTDMDGIAYPGSRDKEAYQQLLGMSDRLFVAVYNDFGELYYKEGNGSLRQWIDDENFGYTMSILTPYGMYTGAEITNKLNERFNNLNLL